MKKNGFTLAEVLITLTIIGVIAALTLPSLNMGVQSSKVGPHLRKFINTISNANEMILMNNQSNTLRSAYPFPAGADEIAVTRNYLLALNGQVRGNIQRNGDQLIPLSDILARHPLEERKHISNYDGNQNDAYNNYSVMLFDSGEGFAIHLRRANAQQRDNANQRPGVFADVLYDMDGFSAGANRLGIDIFAFLIDNRGTVIPVGGMAQANSGYAFAPMGDPTPTNTVLWSNGGNRCSGDSVGTGVNCAGSVADNNWRVIYEY